MANGKLGSWNLLAGVPQAIYVCNNDQASAITLNVVNRSNVSAKIRVAISVLSTPAIDEYLEYDLELLPKGMLERTGLIVGPNMFLIVKSDVALCNAVCWGIEVGASAASTNLSAYAGTTPTWTTAAGVLPTITVGSLAASDSVSVQATDPYSSQLTYTITAGTLPAGSYLDPNGIILNRLTSTGYTAGAAGQTTSFDITASNGTNSIARSFSITKKWNDGSTQALAAPSGYWLAQNIGNKYLSSGTYWIKSAAMPNALQMYVDMTEEGGGYDFYRITGGISATYYTDAHSGTPLGLDLVMPRSKYHWAAQRKYVSNIVGSADYTYFASIAIFRTLTTQAGTYVANPMRSKEYATNMNPTTYAPDWQVKDGGRWWLRDTTFTEPNGDYTLGAWLGDLVGRATYPSSYAYTDIGFNDGTASYSTGTNYIVSTNAKP